MGWAEGPLCSRCCERVASYGHVPVGFIHGAQIHVTDICAGSFVKWGFHLPLTPPLPGQLLVHVTRGQLVTAMTRCCSI